MIRLFYVSMLDWDKQLKERQANNNHFITIGCNSFVLILMDLLAMALVRHGHCYSKLRRNNKLRKPGVSCNWSESEQAHGQNRASNRGYIAKRSRKNNIEKLVARNVLEKVKSVITNAYEPGILAQINSKPAFIAHNRRVSMTTNARAAICRGNQHPFAIEDVVLDDLKPNELRVRIVASGICHTDLAARDAQLPVPLPGVLGHEGAGIVEEVGSEVTAAKPEDRVVMSFNSCGECPSCSVKAPTYCYQFLSHNWVGTRPDGSSTMSLNNEHMNASFFGQSSFATHAIANEQNVVRITDSAAHIPLERIAPIGCGLMTGAGAVLRSMEVRADMPIAIFGTGAVGMAAIMAAKIVGANPIIAVDINDSRLALALELGATHTFNGKDDAIGKIRELCPQGLGYALDTTGLKTIIQDVFNLLAIKGVLGIVGACGPDQTLEFNEIEFMSHGRTVKGILGGDSDLGGGFINELLDYHIEGRFPFDKLIGYFDFEDINKAVEAGESGAVVKPVLRISEE